MQKSYILYADDDAEDHELMEMVIQPYPELRLVSFFNGHDLLNHLTTSPKEEVCVVLLDINMPQLTGIETLKLIRASEEIRDLPVLMFTTSNTPAEKHVARSMNADIITKPYTKGQVELVKDLIISRCLAIRNAS
jgi:CheY-like chemotaxis protein